MLVHIIQYFFYSLIDVKEKIHFQYIILSINIFNYILVKIIKIFMLYIEIDLEHLTYQ